MEIFGQLDDENIDIESGIDTWVIDKEDSNGSCVSLDKGRTESSIHSFQLKTMNKENIKLFQSSERKLLRNFRIPKHIGYQENSSGSESDSKRKGNEGNEYAYWNKKQRLEPAIGLYDKGFARSSSSTFNSLNENKKDKEILSSEEISVILSEVEGSSDGNQENNREWLHSIENVSLLVDDKEQEGGNLSPTINPNFSCSICSWECCNLEELRSHENFHRKSNLPSQQSSEHQNQVNKINTLTTVNSVWKKTDFLDTFKNHLINHGKISSETTDNGSHNVEFRKSVKQSEIKTKTYKCNVCNYYCSELLVFKSHKILFHTDKKDLNCEYCEYQTSQCANLATHIRVHFQLNCPYCDYHTSLKTSLKSHLENCHPNKKCKKCEKSDYSSDTLKQCQKHPQQHTVSSKYQCGDCNLCFSNKQVLKIHIKKHLFVQKTFKCDECDLCYSRKHYLKLHRKSHQQPFICEICNSKFSQKNYLKIHMKIHKTRESFKCEKCNEMFTGRNYLKLHMRIHVPKQSKCQYCSFQCMNPNDLLKHICLTSLYEVETRSLNFHKNITGSDKVNGNQNKLKKGETNLKSPMTNKYIKNEDSNLDQIDKIIKVKSSYKKKSFKINQKKILSLRQNLPSRQNQRALGNANINCDLMPKGSNKDRESKQTLNNKKYDRKTTATRGNAVYKTSITRNTWTITNKSIIIKSQKKVKKNIRKEPFVQSLNCAKILFDKKPSITELLIEPVRFIDDENYVQCYYQSHQSTAAPDHLERHLRQSTLRSCRFCNYKTNSEQLLRRHTAKIHTWDPAVVNMLFS